MQSTDASDATGVAGQSIADSVPVPREVLLVDPYGAQGDVACVTAYVPVHVIDSCGANVVTGHEITGGVPVPENAVSCADTSVNVTLPALTTKNEYATDCPAAVTVVGVTVFLIDSAGDGVLVTVAVDGSDVTADPVGGVPVATAVLVIEPASMSACVTVYVPVQGVDASGASVVTGQVTAGGVSVPEKAVSSAATPVSVELPVLVTRKE